MSVRLNASMPMFMMRQMNLAQNRSNVSMQRLASGLRINSAADDAAGLAIATRMTSEIQGYNQSIRNANDGISMLQIAEGTLGEVSNTLQRMRELTVQAGNDTNSKLNRASISQEVEMLSGSIKDMMDGTQFNGTSLFANKEKSLNMAIEGSDFALNLGEFNYRELALSGGASRNGFSGGRVSANSTNNLAININGTDLKAINGTTEQKTAQLNGQLNAIGITAQGSNQVTGNAGSGVSDGSLTINGDPVASSANINQLVDNINSDVGGIVASVDTNGQLLLSNDTGQDIIVDNHGNEQGTGLINDIYKGMINLTDGTGKGQDITIALNDNGLQSDLDALGLTDMQGRDLLQSQTVSGNALTAADKITVNGYPLDSSSPLSSAYDIATAFNARAAISGVHVSAKNELLISAPDYMQPPTAANDIRINGQHIDLTASSSLDDTISKMNAQLSDSGIVASANSDGKLSLVSELGYDITVEQDSGDFLQTGLGTSTFHGKLSFQSEGAINIDSDISGQSNKEAALAKIGLSDTGGFDESTAGIDLSSAQAVAQSLNTLDQALLNVADVRSSYGAQQNRLGQTINHLSGMAINTESSRSRIMDTDYAAESAALAKNQLLMQTSSAMFIKYTQMQGEKILSLINSLN